MWSLGDLLLLEGDFQGARKMLEQALAMRTAAGEKLTISETQLALADLSLEETRSAVEQEAAVRQVLEVISQKPKARDDEIRAWCVLSRALLAEGRAAAARKPCSARGPSPRRARIPEIRWGACIIAARVEAAQKDASHSAAAVAARQELAAVIGKSQELGFRLVELDARLALAELEMKAGQTAEGRAHLTEIEANAKAKRYEAWSHAKR